MKHFLLLSAAALALAGCIDEQAPVNKVTQADKARVAAESISFTDNAEIDNIKKRIELTAHPGLLGFILLMNEAGQPIMYEGVKGKITSGGKRLTSPTGVKFAGNGNGGNSMAVVPAPSDEGTWGSSGEYIFYWNQNGEYRQWNGKYLYADKPFRLRIEPLVITAQSAEAASR